MTTACGIEMTECRLLEEGGRRHFATKRFDRVDGHKVHMQSLAAMAHWDFNVAGAHSYEETFRLMRTIGLHADSVEDLFRRMCFNIVARNQDDHVKNIAFLMNKQGQWRLSPAYDVTYSYNPQGAWTSKHQMSMNGKRSDFAPDDFKACGKVAGLKRGAAKRILDQVVEVVAEWPAFAAKAEVPAERIGQIRAAHRLF